MNVSLKQSKMLIVSCMVLAVTILPICLTESTYAAGDVCASDAKWTVKNNTGKTLTTVVLLHRLGESADLAQREFWENLKDGDTAKPAVLHFRATKSHTSFHEWDYFTALFSYKESTGDKDEDVVFILNNINGREVLENVRTTLQGSISALSTAELTAFLNGNPAAPFVDPVVGPVMSILANALLGKQ